MRVHAAEPLRFGFRRISVVPVELDRGEIGPGELVDEPVDRTPGVGGLPLRFQALAGAGVLQLQGPVRRVADMRADAKQQRPCRRASTGTTPRPRRCRRPGRPRKGAGRGDREPLASARATRPSVRPAEPARPDGGCGSHSADPASSGPRSRCRWRRLRGTRATCGCRCRHAPGCPSASSLCACGLPRRGAGPRRCRASAASRNRRACRPEWPPTRRRRGCGRAWPRRPRRSVCPFRRTSCGSRNTPEVSETCGQSAISPRRPVCRHRCPRWRPTARWSPPGRAPFPGHWRRLPPCRASSWANVAPTGQEPRTLGIQRPRRRRSQNP